MGIVSLDCCLYNRLDPWMERKQQVGECWVCVIFFACVFVGAPERLMIPLVVIFVSCVGAFLGGKYASPWLRALPQTFFLGAGFAIF
jgi:hypothetical protein